MIKVWPCLQDDTLAVTSKLNLPSEKLGTHTGACSLDDGTLSLTSRAWLCDHAQKTIDIQYYIFSRDNIGLISCDYLVRAADRGVKVRLLIDDATVQANTREIQLLASHPGIEIRIYSPGIKLGKPLQRLRALLSHPGQLNRRMHNKTITIDDVVSITGGRNIADEYYDYDKKYNFRDRDVLLAGKAVADVRTSFELFWNHELSIPLEKLVIKRKKRNADPQRFDKLHQYACDTINFSREMRNRISRFPEEFARMQKSGEFVWLPAVSFVADIPGKNRDRKNRKGGVCTDSILALIKAAKRSIDIQSPYLITTEEDKQLLKDLVGRGVRIRVLTNSLAATDNHEAFSGYHRDREEVLETGIEAYEWKPDPEIRYKLMNPDIQSALSFTPVYGMHSKTMIIDDSVVVVGSYNLDPRSANLNTECVVIFRSPQMIRNVGRWVEEEFRPENAWRITKEFNPDEKGKFNKRIKSESRKVIPKGVL